MWIERAINGARFVVLVKNLVPGCAAVGGAIDTTLRVRAIGMAERGDQNMVRIARIDPNSRDVLRLLQSDVLPGFAAVGGLVDSIAVGDVAAQAGLAGANVDHVRI